MISVHWGSCKKEIQDLYNKLEISYRQLDIQNDTLSMQKEELKESRAETQRQRGMHSYQSNEALLISQRLQSTKQYNELLVEENTKLRKQICNLELFAKELESKSLNFKENL